MVEGSPPASARQLVPLDKLFLELRFPSSLLFQDHVGAISHIAREVFPNIRVEIGQVVVWNEDPEDHRIRLGPGHAWFSPPEGTDFQEFLRWVRPLVDSILRELMLVDTVTRVGLRAYSILAFPTVEEAVRLFKSLVTDYYGGPFGAIAGEPTGVTFELRKGGWWIHEGAQLDLRLFVAPIHLPEIWAERTDLADGPASPMQGALLVDMDGALADGQIVSLASAVDLSRAMYEKLEETVRAFAALLPEETNEVHQRAE